MPCRLCCFCKSRPSSSEIYHVQKVSEQNDERHSSDSGSAKVICEANLGELFPSVAQSERFSIRTTSIQEETEEDLNSQRSSSEDSVDTIVHVGSQNELLQSASSNSDFQQNEFHRKTTRSEILSTSVSLPESWSFMYERDQSVDDEINLVQNSFEAKSISEDSNKMASTQQDLTRLIQRLEAVTTRLEKVPAGGGSHGGPSAGPSSVSVQAFDKILAGPFNTYLELSKKISEDVAKQSSMVETAFVAQRAFLDIASKAKKPSDNELNSLLKPTSDTINEIQTYREAQRRSQYFNHLSAISESIPALGWVSVSPAPAPFVKDMCDAGQFYTNRVLKDWKDKSKTHVEWTKAWLATLTELHAFVKENHTTGLVWNPSGVDASKASSAGSQPSAGGPPPPPPPPPPGLFSDIPSSDKSEAKAINALFADINRGEDVTKGLKKVTSDMQTHKNPNLREGAPPIAPKPKAGSPASSGAGQAPTQRPPRFELEGKKWAIEFHKNHPNLVVEDTDMNQSVYVYRCEGSTIKVEGKVNNIIVDGCKKTAIVFQDVVSSCEFINCQSVQMQVLGKVPTISVEKTDGCQMFLSADSLGVEIVSAKSSEMNVVIPAGDDFVEQPVPEQFKTVIKGTKLITTIAESV